jgi:hypothetical protein
MLTGGCLCGGVRFEVDGTLGPVVCCHCSQCRRASGSAFATNASVRADAFRLRGGAELVREYESSPGQHRAFCGRCGSPLYARADAWPGIRRVRLGSLDGDPGRRPEAHVHVASKAPWHEPCGALPRFEGDGAPALAAPGSVPGAPF